VIARLLATFFGIGFLPYASGTWASLVSLPLAGFIHQWGGFNALVLATLLIAAIGVWAVSAASESQQQIDRPEFVVDEVAGQLLALWAVSWSATQQDITVAHLWLEGLAAFLLFRIFDIFKFGPVAWADRRADAFGVMLDDMIAGALACLLTIPLTLLYHGSV